VKVYLKASSGASFDSMTIFRILHHGSERFVYNKVSMTSVGDDEFSFRTPVSFMAGSDATLAEVEYELEAYLDHLFHHPNLAPFICYRLIQRLVTSNPSPRYVESVVSAFSTGSYNNETFSGQYGDLRAALYAILLDRDARSDILEGDPTHGRLREPYMKILHVLRAMEYVPQDGNRLLDLQSLEEKIGQQFSKQPSVFGITWTLTSGFCI